MPFRTLIIAVLLCLLTGCKEPVLSDLTERQANEVIGVLAKYHIFASKQHSEKQRYNVLLLSQDMLRAITLITEYQLPAKEDIEIDSFFPVDALVASPRAEKARLISAIEQKLQQSLVRLDGVVDARVHMSYPLDEDNRLQSKPARRISVLLVHRPTLDAQIFANKIRLFVLNSFSEVKLENITVVMFVRVEPPLTTTSESTIGYNNFQVATGFSVLFVTIFIALLLYIRKK